MADEEDDSETATKVGGQVRWWLRALFVLGPALVGGLFTLSPKLYDELTKPKATLAFTSASGPAISTSSGARQISSIRAENTGKVPLTNVVVEVQVSDGQIESSALEQSPGIKPVSQAAGGTYRVVAERLLPTEFIAASVMTLSSSTHSSLKLAVRSNEILGTIAAPITPGYEGPGELIVAIATSFAIAVTSLLIIFTIRHRRISVAGLFSAAHYKSDVITYVCAVSGVLTSPDELFYHNHTMTFLRAGDLFLFAGLNADPERRNRCVLALRALLEVRDMADTSALAIRANLELLGAPLTNSEFKAAREKAQTLDSDFLAARRRVVEIFGSTGTVDTKAT